MGINFIQIGANIGNTDTDIIWSIVRKNKWNGIFVEPISESFDQLIKNYSDLKESYFENIVITDYEGNIDIFSQKNSKYHSQQASINKKHFGGQNNLKHTIKCMTLNHLVKKYKLEKQEFELLQIDAEGHDHIIILSTDFNIVTPQKIRFEKIHLTKLQLHTTVEYLNGYNYIKINDEYENFVTAGERGFDIMFKKNKL